MNVAPFFVIAFVIRKSRRPVHSPRCLRKRKQSWTEKFIIDLLLCTNKRRKQRHWIQSSFCVIRTSSKWNWFAANHFFFVCAPNSATCLCQFVFVFNVNESIDTVFLITSTNCCLKWWVLMDWNRLTNVDQIKIGTNSLFAHSPNRPERKHDSKTSAIQDYNLIWFFFSSKN